MIFLIFIRFKKDGFYRVIFNLKKLNELVIYYYFKMDMLEIVIRFMRFGCYMIFIDLKDVYYFIFIVEEY